MHQYLIGLICLHIFAEVDISRTFRVIYDYFKCTFWKLNM